MVEILLVEDNPGDVQLFRRLLSGPHHAAGWLRHGGLVVYDSGKFDVIDPAGVRG